MFKELMQRSVEGCEAIGARILPRLKADPRLTDAADALQAGQDGLKAKEMAYQNAVEVVRSVGAAERVNEFETPAGCI